MKIIVFGIGSLGSNVLVNLSKIYPDAEFMAVDHDKVEKRNIGPQAYFLEHCGMAKVTAMHSLLFRFNSNVKYCGINEKIESFSQIEKIISEGADLVIDCFDTAESRSLFRSGINIPVLHGGFSPHFTGEISWDENFSTDQEVDPQPADICSLIEAVPFIGIVVSLMTFTVINFLSRGAKESYIITDKNKIKRIN